MATRPLNDHEYVDMISRHDDVYKLVLAHESMFGFEGYRKWDQVLFSQGHDEYGDPLPIPPRGITFYDQYYGNIVIFPDAAGVLRVITTDNTGLVEDLKRPVFESDPDYWELFESIAKKYGEAAGGLLQGSSYLAVVALVVAAFVFIGKR